MEIITWGMTFVGMASNTVCDIRSRRILLRGTVIWCVLGIAWHIVRLDIGPIEFGIGLIPGILIFLASAVTKGAIGQGDALVLLMSGIWLGGRINALICVAAIFLAGVYAAILLLFFHKGRKYEIPFVPFLLAGLVIVRWMECS